MKLAVFGALVITYVGVGWVASVLAVRSSKFRDLAGAPMLILWPLFFVWLPFIGVLEWLEATSKRVGERRK